MDTYLTYAQLHVLVLCKTAWWYPAPNSLYVGFPKLPISLTPKCHIYNDWFKPSELKILVNLRDKFIFVDVVIPKYVLFFQKTIINKKNI